ncbi:hypothetical protein, partial [Streptomyces clavuligerus]
MTSPSPPPERSPDATGDEHDSATALGSHWFERPGSRPPGAESPTLVQGAVPEDAAPDRVEGEIRRFGPGVTAADQAPPTADTAVTAVTAAALWHGGPPPPGGRHRGSRLRGLRRYALAAVVLVAVLGVLLWQRYGQPITVERVAARADAVTLGCEGTADIVGVVGTNGQPGTLVYRWVRSDGTTSDLLREKVTRGQHRAELRLLWTFTGRGDIGARAELRIVSPSAHHSTA